MDHLFQEYDHLETCVLDRGGKISTSSVYIQFSSEIDMKILPDLFEIRVPGTKKNRRSNYNNFQNSITVVFNKSLCAKIFKSGAQICGCKSLDNVKKACLAICEKLEVRVAESKIHLFNVNYKIGHNIDLFKIFEKLKDQLIVSYDRDEYSGLKIKVPLDERHLTGLLFASGSMILTGCKSKSDLLRLYNLTDQIKSLC